MSALTGPNVVDPNTSRNGRIPRAASRKACVCTVPSLSTHAANDAGKREKNVCSASARTGVAGFTAGSASAVVAMSRSRTAATGAGAASTATATVAGMATVASAGVAEAGGLGAVGAVTETETAGAGVGVVDWAGEAGAAARVGAEIGVGAGVGAEAGCEAGVGTVSPAGFWSVAAAVAGTARPAGRPASKMGSTSEGGGSSQSMSAATGGGVAAVGVSWWMTDAQSDESLMTAASGHVRIPGRSHAGNSVGGGAGRGADGGGGGRAMLIGSSVTTGRWSARRVVSRRRTSSR